MERTPIRSYTLTVMKRTTISLPDDLSQLLHQEARRKGTSVSSVVRDLVASGLTGSQDRVRSIPWAGLFEDPKMVPGREVKEALKGDWDHAIDRDRGTR